MGTWNAFYIRVQTQAEEVKKTIKEHYPEAEIEVKQEFIGAALSPDEFTVPEKYLSELSSRFNTDVIWMSFQSVVDAFQFHHWYEGKLLRSLVFGCFEEERTWERVEGKPEPWERDVFFDPKQLEFSLEIVGTDEERQELERIWREAELSPGRTEPNIDSRECAHKIAAFYHLPGYY